MRLSENGVLSTVIEDSECVGVANVADKDSEFAP